MIPTQQAANTNLAVDKKKCLSMYQMNCSAYVSCILCGMNRRIGNFI